MCQALEAAALLSSSSSGRVFSPDAAGRRSYNRGVSSTETLEERSPGGRRNQQLGQVHLWLGFASFCSCHVNLASYKPMKFLFGDRISTFHLNFRSHITSRLLKEN